MARRGRPPAHRGVFSFEDLLAPVPEAAVIDTSFLIEALSPAQPLHAPAQAYLERLAAAGRTLLVFNRLLELELAETAYLIALKERHKKDFKRFRHDGRARRRANRLLQGTLDAWADLLTVFDHATYDVGEVGHRVPELMTRYGLGSYDAVHAATALEAGVLAMITTDTGFANLPQTQLTIYTNAGRVPDCRRFRQRT